MRDRDRRVVEEFRANRGRVGGTLAGTPLLLLHHVGMRSGIEHVTPLVATRHARGYVVVASAGGSAAHPAWYRNLKHHPVAEIEIGGERMAVQAVELDGAARERVWGELLAVSPSLRGYDAATTRRIPVVLLAQVTTDHQPRRAVDSSDGHEVISPPRRGA